MMTTASISPKSSVRFGLTMTVNVWQRRKETLFLTPYEGTYQSQNTSIVSPLFSVTHFMAKQFLKGIAKNADLGYEQNQHNEVSFIIFTYYSFIVFWCCFVLFLRQDLTIYFWLSRNSICSPGASNSQRAAFLCLPSARNIWLMLDILAFQTSKAYVFPGIHFSICNPWQRSGICCNHGLCCWQRSRWCLWFKLPPRAMLIFVSCAATWAQHVGWGSCCFWSRVGICGPCGGQKPCVYLWSVFPPETMIYLQSILPLKVMLMSISCAVNEGQDDLCGPCWD